MSVPFLDSEVFHWFVPLSVFGASLLGSPHCVAMCGPLTLSFSRHGRKGIVFYQLGRGIAYSTAGGIAGAIGHVSFGAKAMPWLSALTLFIIAMMLFLAGIRILLNQSLHLPVPALVNNVLSAFSRRIWGRVFSARISPTLGSLIAGILTVFLPCGHLLGFLAGAMATGTAFRGAVFMAAFWLGTVPALGFGVGWLSAIMRPGMKAAPRWSGVLLISAGLISLAAFATRVSEPPAAKHEAVHCRH